jgi:hypothetical protein
MIAQVEARKRSLFANYSSTLLLTKGKVIASAAYLIADDCRSQR